MAVKSSYMAEEKRISRGFFERTSGRLRPGVYVRLLAFKVSDFLSSFMTTHSKTRARRGGPGDAVYNCVCLPPQPPGKQHCGAPAPKSILSRPRTSRNCPVSFTDSALALGDFPRDTAVAN